MSQYQRHWIGLHAGVVVFILALKEQTCLFSCQQQTAESCSFCCSHCFGSLLISTFWIDYANTSVTKHELTSEAKLMDFETIVVMAGNAKLNNT